MTCASCKRAGEIQAVSLEEVRDLADLKGRGSSNRWPGRKTLEKRGSHPHTRLQLQMT